MHLCVVVRHLTQTDNMRVRGFTHLCNNFGWWTEFIMWYLTKDVQLFSFCLLLKWIVLFTMQSKAHDKKWRLFNCYLNGFSYLSKKVLYIKLKWQHRVVHGNPAVLKVLELVPDECCQKFTKPRRSESQIYVEFVHLSSCQFNSWISPNSLKNNCIVSIENYPSSLWVS